MTDPTIPEPERHGVVYTCNQRTGENFFEDRCGHPFIFRSSYERHWREEHGTVAVDYDPAALDPLNAALARSDDAMGRVEAAVERSTMLVDEAQQILAYRAGTFAPMHEEPVPFTEVDRKEAAARLDAYLEQTDFTIRSASFERAHDVEVQLCCEDPNCRIRYHFCRVCEIVTLVPPPLPCPGRKDTP